ncbi:hypothetical protein ACU8DI_11080 [Psychroserpens sp. BH13MA-6]
MKNLIILISVLIANVAFGQPNPQEGYPERIKAITEQLKTDSLNYELIWERLNMKVNLMGGFDGQDEIFSLKNDSIKIAKRRELYFDEFNTDFNKIYKNIIKEKVYDTIEESDFYLNRIWFYYQMGEIEKSIEDAKYLRDSASYSRYWQRGDYYKNWALYSLFNLYVINDQYIEALKAIDTMLKEKKKKNPKIYFAGHGSSLSFGHKIRLFEHFDEKDKIIPFLKESCSEQFNWYFENTANSKDYYIKTAKHQSFYFLKQLVDYMKAYNDKELPKYEKFYKQLRYQLNKNYETINPNISDKELKLIVSQI